MAAKKVGTLIKEARTAAGLTQEQLARKVSGVSAADVGRVERGEADFTQAQLKLIAKALGVTQASLLNAPKNLGKTTAAKKPASTATKKPAASSSAKKPAASSTAKTPANANSTMKVTATERKLVESYRTASADAKKAAAKILKGECENLLDQINNKTPDVANVVSDLLGGALGQLFNK